MKYVDRLKESGSDAEKAKQFELAASRASLQWEANLLETRSQLASAKGDLESLKSSTSLSAQVISDKMDQIEGLEKGLARLEALKAELFG